MLNLQKVLQDLKTQKMNLLVDDELRAGALSSSSGMSGSTGYTGSADWSGSAGTR